MCFLAENIGGICFCIPLKVFNTSSIFCSFNFGIGFSSIGFNLAKNLKSDESIYVKISKNKSKSNLRIHSPIAPGKIEEIFIDIGNYLKKMKLLESKPIKVH